MKPKIMNDFGFTSITEEEGRERNIQQLLSYFMTLLKFNRF